LVCLEELGQLDLSHLIFGAPLAKNVAHRPKYGRNAYLAQGTNAYPFAAYYARHD
jgi:hypothetical protein